MCVRDLPYLTNYQTLNNLGLKLKNSFAGSFPPELAHLVVLNLPLELTFVDHQDLIQYFTQQSPPIFTRSSDIIGTNVVACHSKPSQEIVRQLLKDLRSGVKDREEEVIDVNGKPARITYFALRSADGEYLGVVETVQELS